jgi:hypothetical protein
MRETVLEMPPQRPALPQIASATVELKRAVLLKKGTGEVWRSADIVGSFQGVGLRCSVAQRLP